MMDRDKRLTGHIRGQSVRYFLYLLWYLCFLLGSLTMLLCLCFFFRRNQWPPRVLVLIVFGIRRRLVTRRKSQAFLVFFFSLHGSFPSRVNLDRTVIQLGAGEVFYSIDERLPSPRRSAHGSKVHHRAIITRAKTVWESCHAATSAHRAREVMRTSLGPKFTCA
jgi:hypothetical protein